MVPAPKPYDNHIVVINSPRSQHEMLDIETGMGEDDETTVLSVEPRVEESPPKSARSQKRTTVTKVDKWIAGKEGDPLDYVFGHVESFVCKEGLEPSSSTITAATASKPTKNIASSPMPRSNSMAEGGKSSGRVVPATAASTPATPLEDIHRVPSGPKMLRGISTSYDLTKCTSFGVRNGNGFLCHSFLNESDVRSPPEEKRDGPPDEEQTLEESKQEVTRSGEAPSVKKKDALDYLFEHVESLICRDRKPKSSIQTCDDNDSLVEDPGTANSSPIKLHSVTPLTQHEGDDALDIVFGKIEGCVCREDENETAEHQKHQHQPQALDKASLSGNSMSVKPIRRDNSLLDFDRTELASDSVEVENDLSHIDSLRRKKREIESIIQSSSSEPGILVPRIQSRLAVQAKDRASVEAAAKEDRGTKLVKLVIAALVFAMLVAAIVLIAISVIWPSNSRL